MSEIINHEEAYLISRAKQGESNLARCYLDIKAQRDELLEALEEIEWSNNEQWRTERARIAIAKAKREK